MKKDTLIKYWCFNCDEKFLLNMSRTKKHLNNDNLLSCPYCKSTDVDDEVYSDDDQDLELGCLGLYDYEMEG